MSTAHQLARGLGTTVAWLSGAAAWLAGGLLALCAAALVMIWAWSGTAQSLQQTLDWTARWLAKDDQGTAHLTVVGAHGSLRNGGKVENLRWQRDGLTLELDQLELRWSDTFWLDVLLHRRAVVDMLSMHQLRADDQRPPQPDAPRQPPQSLELPWLQVLDLKLDAQNIVWVAAQPWAVGPLKAHYRYGADAALKQPTLVESPPSRKHNWHHLHVDTLHWQAGHYQADIHLQAAQPMALQARLEGKLTQTLPKGKTVKLAVNALVSGALAPQDATLQLNAQMQADGRMDDGAPSLQAEAELHPWADMPLHRASLEFRQLDLAMFWPNAPETRLIGSAQAQSAANENTWQLTAKLQNTNPGPWDRQRLPLARLDTRVSAEILPRKQLWTLHAMQALLAGGSLQAQGQATLRDGQLQGWSGEATTRNLEPMKLHSQLQMRALNGDLTAQAETASGPTNKVTHFALNVNPAAQSANGQAAWPAPEIAAKGRWKGGAEWQVDDLNLQFLEAQLAAQGTLSTGPWAFRGQVDLNTPGANLSVQAGANTRAQLDLNDLAALQRWSLQTVADWNRMLPHPAWAVQLPPIWTGPQWQGQTTLQAGLTGDVFSLQQQGRVQAQSQGLRWQVEHDVQAQGTWAEGGLSTTLNALNLSLSNDRHPLRIQTRLHGKPTLQVKPSGDIAVQAGELRLTPQPANALRQRPLPAFSSQPLTLAWEHLRWADGRLSSKGRWDNLALSWLNAWMSNDATPQGPLHHTGLQGELMLQGDWDVDLPLTVPATAHPVSSLPRARLNLQHSQGDLTLVLGNGPNAERLAAGIETARVTLQLSGHQASAEMQWRSRKAGQASAKASTVLAAPNPATPHWAWADNAPLTGELKADLPQLGLWSRLAPPGWRISGRLQVQTTLAGTRSQPHWLGSLQASQLTVRSLPDGLDFSDGALRAQIEGETLTIQRLHLRGAGGATGGLLEGQGTATWARREVNGQTVREPVIDLRLQAQKLRLLARADRRLTLSGELAASLRGQRLDLTGKLNTDQALFLLPDESTPRLGNDVVLRGTERGPGFGAGAAVQPHVSVEFGLGDNFQVRGLGLQSHLKGQLRFTATPEKTSPQITGEVQTVRGTYLAYGQSLKIEHGVVRFNGHVDNPSLDILALRPHPTQRVGVQIGGTAQAPRVRLYAEPDMPDSEKLAWLVLGRPATGAGAEAAVLQQAAFALLSSRGNSNERPVSAAIGLDELSFQGESTATDGTTTAAALTLGKRISNQLYVSYSRSLTGAVGTVAVFYDISRWVTLRGQAGDDNAIDLLFTYSYDGQDLPENPHVQSAPRSP